MSRPSYSGSRTEDLVLDIGDLEDLVLDVEDVAFDVENLEVEDRGLRPGQLRGGPRLRGPLHEDGEDEVKYLVLDNIEDVVLELEGRGHRPRRRGRQFDCFYIICVI